MFARNSRIPLDFTCQREDRTLYVRRNLDRYHHIPGYAESTKKRDAIYSNGEVERIGAEGWHATINIRSVHVFGDLDKMNRDLTMLLMADDLVAE